MIFRSKLTIINNLIRKIVGVTKSSEAIDGRNSSNCFATPTIFRTSFHSMEALFRKIIGATQNSLRKMLSALSGTRAEITSDGVIFDEDARIARGYEDLVADGVWFLTEAVVGHFCVDRLVAVAGEFDFYNGSGRLHARDFRA